MTFWPARYVADCFQLDHNQVIWKPFPRLVLPRANSGGATITQGWWLIGGHGDGSAQNTTEVYKNGAWQLGPNIPDLKDFWYNKPCIAMINDTHTFVAGGNAQQDSNTAWIYNWLDNKWTIQEFVPVSLGTVSSCVLIQRGTSKLVLAGTGNEYSFFNLETSTWNNTFFSESYCDFSKIEIINGTPVALNPGSRACTFNGTNWMVSPDTLTIDFGRVSQKHALVAYTTPIQGKSCQSNVMVATGRGSIEYPPSVEVIPVASSSKGCQLPPFPVSGFDVSLLLHKKEIVGCNYQRCYKLDRTSGQWIQFTYLEGYIWTSVEPTFYGMWKTGGASSSSNSYCEKYYERTKYCYGNYESSIHCHGNDRIIEGPQLPVKAFGHCTINLNETHTIIAGGLQSNSSSSNQCSSSPFANGDAYCKSDQTWVYNWATEEWRQLQDLPRPAAFASCGKVTVNGKKFIFLYGQPDIQYSREGVFQLWSFEDETWSADVSQPFGTGISLPSEYQSLKFYSLLHTVVEPSWSIQSPKNWIYLGKFNKKFK